RRVDARLGYADRAGRDRIAPRVERGHRDLEAVTDLAEPVRIGHSDIVEDELARIRRAQPQLSVERLAAVGLPVALEHERRDAFGFLRGIALGEHEGELRDRAV